MYNAERWTKSTTAKAAVFERKCLKKFMRLFYRPRERNWRNEYEKAKLKSLEEVQEERQWSYLGHVLRRQEGSPHRELMNTFEKTKNRRRGRPRSKLFEEMREKIRRRGLKVEELVLAAGNRQEWRRRTVKVRRSERNTRKSPPADEC